MRSTVAQFCKQCGTCALMKDSTQHAHGQSQHCNHCQYYLPDSIPTPLTLSLTYLLHRASIVSSLSSIISLSLCVSYPVPWGKTNCQLHKSQNYCLKTLLGFLECQKSLFMIVIPGLLLIFGVNYGIFLALKPVPPLHFTLRLMGRVSAPIAHIRTNLMSTHSQQTSVSMVRCTTIYRICNKQYN